MIGQTTNCAAWCSIHQHLFCNKVLSSQFNNIAFPFSCLSPFSVVFINCAAHYISFYFAIKLKHSLSFLSTAGDLFLWQLLNKDAGGLNILLISLFLLPKELYCRDSIFNVKYLSWGENICDCKMGRGEIGLFVLCWKSNPLPLVPISLPADSITHQYPHFCPLHSPLSRSPAILVL